MLTNDEWRVFPRLALAGAHVHLWLVIPAYMYVYYSSYNIAPIICGASNSSAVPQFEALSREHSSVYQ